MSVSVCVCARIRIIAQQRSSFVRSSGETFCVRMCVDGAESNASRPLLHTHNSNSDQCGEIGEQR